MWLCAALFVYQSFALHVNNIRVMVWSLACCQLSARSKMGDAKRRRSQMETEDPEICIISQGAVVNMENMRIVYMDFGSRPSKTRRGSRPTYCTALFTLIMCQTAPTVFNRQTVINTFNQHSHCHTPTERDNAVGIFKRHKTTRIHAERALAVR